MAKMKINPFDARTTFGSGVSISLNETRGGQVIKITVNAKAQERLFGGPLDPQADALALDLDDAAGKTHLLGLRRCAHGTADALPLGGGARGSVTLRLAPWCQLAAGRRLAAQMGVASQGVAGEVVVTLPGWARPEPRKIGQGKPLMEC